MYSYTVDIFIHSAYMYTYTHVHFRFIIMYTVDCYLHICTIILDITSRHAHIQNFHRNANYSYSYIYLFFSVRGGNYQTRSQRTWFRNPQSNFGDIYNNKSIILCTMYVLYVGQIYSMRHLPPGEARKKEAHTDYWPMIHRANIDLCVDKS